MSSQTSVPAVAWNEYTSKSPGRFNEPRTSNPRRRLSSAAFSFGASVPRDWAVAGPSLVPEIVALPVSHSMAVSTFRSWVFCNNCTPRQSPGPG